MFKKWQAIKYNGTVWVFRNGALLDSWTEKFAIKGSLATGELLADRLNGK